MGRNSNRPAAAAAAAAVAANGDEPPMESAEVAANGDDIPPPSAEVFDGGESMAEAEEERRDSSPEREGEVAKLKVLNAKLLREAVEKRGQVAALTASVDELSADAGTLADWEREVLRDALAGPLLDAAEEAAALRARLAAIQDSLGAAEAGAARETEARGEAAARLEVAVAEKHQALELLGAKEAEAEAAAASNQVAELEGVVVELEGKIAEMRAERSQLEKQSGEMQASAGRLQAQKAEVEESFEKFKKSTERYEQQAEEKLEEKLWELEALRCRKAEMAAKVESLEAELSAAVTRSRKLEAEVEASKTESATASREAEELRMEVAELVKKHSVVATEADGLRIEINRMVKMKEAAMAAFADEKSALERELEGLTRKVDWIQAEKDVAMGMAHEKDAKAAELSAELERLHSSMAVLRVLCDELSANSSCLQQEKDSVLKVLDRERTEAGKLKLRVGELESSNGEKDHEIGVLKAEVEDKGSQIDGMNGELEQLQLAVAEAQQREKNGVWTWLCPATTTVFAAASFVYAARSR